MSKKFLTHLDLNKNELQNGVIQNLASAPASPVKGQVYFDSTLNVLGAWDGTAWIYYTASALSLTLVYSWLAAQRSPTYELADAATILWDMSLGNNFAVTLGGNRTIGIPSNIGTGRTGQIGSFDFYQDLTGTRVPVFPWVYVFPGGTAPTFQTSKFALDGCSYKVINNSVGTCTISNATPAVITFTAHGIKDGEKVQFTTTGALPTGLSASTTYYVHVTGLNTFNVATSLVNLRAGTYVATSSAGSGVHTADSKTILISGSYLNTY